MTPNGEEFNGSWIVYPEARTLLPFTSSRSKLPTTRRVFQKFKVGGGPAPHITSGVSAASSPLQGLFCSVVPKPKHA